LPTIDYPEDPNVKRIVLLVLLLSLVAGCQRIQDKIAGSGKLQTQKREVGPFTSISTEGAFAVEVVCQQPQSIEIEGDDNVLSLVSTEVSNNVLHIKSARSYSVSHPITLRISVPDLVGIAATGAGNITVSGIKGEKFDIEASGAPSIKASGETKLLGVDASGAGTIDTHRLRAARVVVEAKGVAKVEVFAGEQLDATISGPSQVVYEGDPVVNKTINGPGTLEKKAAGGS
jgi:hypothetical protein